MNIYGFVILGTIIFNYILSGIADFLNLKALREDLPGEFEDVYDAEAYRRSQTYTRVRTRFGVIVDTINLGIVLSFWFLGGFNHLDIAVRSWQFGPVMTGLVYIGILLLAKTIISLPFSIYLTFVIEERFGFNKTTPKTFAADVAKGLALSTALGGPLLAGVLAFFVYGGDCAWLYGWGILTLFMLALQYIAPTWIFPLFNKFTPIEEGELKERIVQFAKDVKFPLRGIYVMDGSRRSSKSNAFFSGIGKNKRIALYDTLLANHTVSEVVGILAHEIGHYQKRHIAQNMAIAILHNGFMLFLLSIFLHHDGLFAAFFMDAPSVYAGLIFFGMLYAPIELILSIFLQIVSRRHELQADRFAAESLHDPEPLVSGLKKLARNNLNNLTPHPFYVFLHYSHPPLLTRIRTLQKTAM